MFIWTMLTIGNAWMLVMYNREYFYRIAGPKVMPHSGIPWSQLSGVEDFFIPRTMRLQFPGYFSLK
jgi:hypothetical protein